MKYDDAAIRLYIPELHSSSAQVRRWHSAMRAHLAAGGSSSYYELRAGRVAYRNTSAPDREPGSDDE